MRLARRLASSMLLVLLGTGAAQAALGERIVAEASARGRFSAVIRVARAATHTLHERQTAAGATVREYVGKDQKVFAVTWEGPFRPDLRELLGAHYDSAFSTSRLRRSRGPVTIRVPGLVIFMGGHPRAWFGRAYLEQALPAGLPIQEIR